MAKQDEDGIGWCDYTFNPWMGCTKISQACDNCYAAVSTPARTKSIIWGAGQPRIRTSPANWKLPLLWNKQAANAAQRPRVFSASLADVFDNEVDPQWRADLFELIAATPNLNWLLLTKRIGNANAMIADALCKIHKGANDGDVPQNVWLGATICNQAEADRDIPKLLSVPAEKRFLSIEPMLGSINLRIYGAEMGRALIGARKGIDLVICGGESGRNARPMHPAWPRSLRDQCEAAGVAFWFKQWGEFAPNNYNEGVGEFMEKMGKKIAGRLLDGREWNGMPS